METFEDSVITALVSGSKIAVLMPLMEEFERKAEAGEICDDIEVLKTIFYVFDEYMERARLVLSPLQILELDPVFASCLNCIIHLVICNKEAHDYLLEETCVMETLTSCLNDKYDVENEKIFLRTLDVNNEKIILQTLVMEHEKIILHKLDVESEKIILRTLDTLTRRLKVQWSAPYLSSLMKNLFQRLVTKPKSPMVFLYCLRILINLVGHSSSCLNIAARDANYREVMKLLVTMMGNEDNDPHILMLMTHLGYLIEPSVNGKTALLIKYVKTSFAAILADYIKNGQTNRNDVKDSLASHIYYLSQCVSTILAQLGKEHEDEFAYVEIVVSRNVGNGDGNSGCDLVAGFVRDIANRVIPDFFQMLPVIQQESPQMVVESLLGLLTACFPHSIPVNVYDPDVLESLMKCIDTLASITRPKTSTHLVVLKTYNHFVDRILGGKAKDVPYELFHNAFNSCQIVPNADPKDLVRNVEIIRLLANFTNMVAFNDLVKKHLDETLILKLVECLFAEKLGSIKATSLLKSMCLVEALNVLFMKSKSPTVLMESIQAELTLMRILYNIVNGDDGFIPKGISLTRALRFTQKCRNDVYKFWLEESEEQVEELKAENKKLEAVKKEATESLIQLMTESAKTKKKLEDVEAECITSKQRVDSLEKDLKKSEESRKATENLLEAEQRKTEIIQQVLGNRQ